MSIEEFIETMGIVNEEEEVALDEMAAFEEVDIDA